MRVKTIKSFLLYSMVVLFLLVCPTLLFAQSPNRQVFWPATENPISQSGIWLNGLLNGLNASNVQSNGLFAFGTQTGCTPNPPTCPFNDSTAVLTGSWGPTQTMWGMVHLANATDNSHEEIELRLRTTITANNIPGYEMQFGGNYQTCFLAYGDIVRWRGGNPLTFDSLAFSMDPKFCLKDRDIVGATVSGSTPNITLTEYICPLASNYVCTQVNQVHDTNQDGANGINSGSMGVGFYREDDTGHPLNTDFGFYEIYATDNTAPGVLIAPSNSESDVQGTIIQTSAAGGDTVQIPCSGTQSSTWANVLTIGNNLILTALGATPNSGALTFGAGTNCLTVRDNYAGGELIQAQIPFQSGQVFTLQNFNIDPFSNVSTPLYSPISIAGTCTASGCPQVRVDNMGYGIGTQWLAGVGNNGGNATWMNRVDNAFGVFDHNTMPTGNDAVWMDSELSAYLGVGAFGDNSWATPDTFGSASALYMENNKIYVTRSFSDSEIAPVGGGIGGSRTVARYNQITTNNGFGIFGIHGLDTDGRPRSGRQIEAYGNSISCVGTGSCAQVTGYRGGTGYTFNNPITETSSGFFGYITTIAIYRNVYTNTPFGACGGLNTLDPWDTNDNTVYATGVMTSGTAGLVLNDSTKTWTAGQWVPSGAPYTIVDLDQFGGTGYVAEIVSNGTNTLTVLQPIPESAWYNGGAGQFQVGDHYEIIRSTICADQAGRGAGNGISGSSPTPSAPLNQALDPIYEWNDSVSPVRLNANMAPSGRTLINRDFYTDNWYPSTGPHAQTSTVAPFNGSTTCNAGAGNYTCGVGFGILALRPTSCSPTVGYWATDVGLQGSFYKCLTANTWTLSYAPFTYPHPLENVSPPPPVVTPTAPGKTTLIWTGIINKSIPTTISVAGLKQSVPLVIDTQTSPATSSFSLTPVVSITSSLIPISISCSCDFIAQTCNCSAK